ncbi:MAG: hypothetical protein ACTHME_05070 [Candidatus Nitrosocosmicus sp.]
MKHRKILSYCVVSCHYYDMQEFVNLVNIRINEGYQPYGSAFCESALNGSSFLYQPMVKYEY